MSMNGNLNGHGKILMLALMMVTSTFAVIGTTAAGPSGYENVTWDATNGYMSTSNGYVYVYNSVADVDMTFTSTDLELGETYELTLTVYEHPYGTEISYNTYTWNATDADGDWYADNSTELLSSEGMEDGFCYDAHADLHHIDAAGDFNWLAGIAQLIGINVEECDMDNPWPTLDIYGDYNFNVGDGMPFEIHVGDLDETKNYTLAWGLYEQGDYDECPFDQDHPDSPCNVEACTDEGDNWEECDAAVEEYCANNEDPACDPNYNPDQWLAGSEDPDHILVDLTTDYTLYLNLTQYIDSDGCYYLEAAIFGDMDGEEPVTPESFVDWFDTDGDGNLSLNEIIDGINADNEEYGEDPLTAEDEDYFEDAFNEADENGNGLLDLEELVHFIYLIDGDDDGGPLADNWHGFEVGAGCYDEPTGHPHVWVYADKSFDPMNNQMDWYAAEEPIFIDYGAKDLFPDTFYTSILQIMGPHDVNGNHDDNSESSMCEDCHNNCVMYSNDSDECHEDCEANYCSDAVGGDDEGDDHDDHEINIPWEHYNNFTTDNEGYGTEGVEELPAANLDSGVYSVMYTVVEIDTDTGEMLAVFFEQDSICVGENPCAMFGHGPDLDPQHYTTGEAHYRMYFDQFEDKDNTDEYNHNGVLEIFSAQELDPSYRMFADFNGDGEVDLNEAMEFINMLMDMDNDEGDCPFADNISGSPCEPVATNPCYGDHESQECGDYVFDYCENIHPDDPACMDMEFPQDDSFYCDNGDEIPWNWVNDGVWDCENGEDEYGDECPFDQDHPDSPCNVEVCDPSSENNSEAMSEACNEHIIDYCENINPDDPFCGEFGECPFDQDHPDSPCNVEVCDPSSGNANDSACNEHIMDYCENINPDDPACDGGEENGTQGHQASPDADGDGVHNDDDDDCCDVTLDGGLLGDSDWEWVWIEGLMGPIDGSDGVPVTLLHGMGWDLSLDDWKTTDQHTVTISNGAEPLVEPCTENDASSGSFSVYDSWSWSPLEPDMGTWAVHADGDGWMSPFDCDSGNLVSLSVTFVKTIKDYNADNLEDMDEGPQNDWEQDVTDNLPPECHVFLVLLEHPISDVQVSEDGIEYDVTTAEEHFSAPTGDHTVELAPGNYELWASCHDPEGDMVWASISAGGVTVDFLEEDHGEGYVAFPMIAGMDPITVEYHWDSSGGQSGSGTITISVIAPPEDNNTGDTTVDPITHDDGTVSCPSGLVLNADATECVAPAPDNVGDIIDDVTLEDEGGAIPGFTTALSVISMLGAVLVMSRRKQDC